VSTLGVVLTAVCAVLAVGVVRLVNRLQMSRPWTPWWATDPSTAPHEMTDTETPVRIQLWSAQHLQQIQGVSVTTPYGQGPQPYGQQPYGEPQMGYPAAPGGVRPYNYLAWSIVSIFLFWPLGIAAIINATKVDPAWQMGNAAMAQEHSNKAKMWNRGVSALPPSPAPAEVGQRADQVGSDGQIVPPHRMIAQPWGDAGQPR
jgi:hypothetical protein